jgi:hypothetical protein
VPPLQTRVRGLYQRAQKLVGRKKLPDAVSRVERPEVAYEVVERDDGDLAVVRAA